MSRRGVDRRVWLGVAVAGAAVLVWMGLTAGIVWSTLDAQERRSLSDLLNPRSTLVAMMIVALFGALAFAVRALVGHFVEPVAQLAEEWKKRNTKVIGLSVDGVDDHKKWKADLEHFGGCAADFPIIADDGLAVSKAFDMLPAEAYLPDGRPAPLGMGWQHTAAQPLSARFCLPK